MRIHFVQHVPFEDAAHIASWAGEHGHVLSCTQLYAGQPLPAQEDFDWLAVMGGPMNVYAHDRYPWLLDEKRFISETFARGGVVFGVCLGAQLLADVFGGPVTRNKETEIGWHSVHVTPEGQTHPLFQDWPEEATVFHWHGDTFTIPPRAVRIASSEACANQAFVFEDRAVGLQCHIEYTPESIGAMLEHCGEELVDGTFIQSREEIVEQMHRVESTRPLLYMMLDRLEERWGN